MLPETVLKQMVARIHATRELAGCAVGYYVDGTCRTIGYPSSVTPNSENVSVVIEEIAFAENAPQVNVPKGAELQQPARTEKRSSKIGRPSGQR